MASSRVEAGGATPPARRSPWRWVIIAGVVVLALALVPFGLLVLGHLAQGDIPSFPSLIDTPDPSIQGTVAFVDTNNCVAVVPAGGGASKEVLCLPALDPAKAMQEGKPMGPQLVWLPDGRLEVTMVNMDVRKPPAGEPPEYRPGWQKIVDVRSGEVTDVPTSQLPTDLNLTTRPTMSPSGEQVSFTSNSEGRVEIELTDATGAVRTLLKVDGPGEYTYGLRAAFWSPDYSYILADDGRILVVTIDDPSVTRELVGNGNGFGEDPSDASFAVTAENLLASAG